MSDWVGGRVYSPTDISDWPLLFNDAMQFVFLDHSAISGNNFFYKRSVLETSIFIPDEWVFILCGWNVVVLLQSYSKFKVVITNNAKWNLIFSALAHMHVFIFVFHYARET